MSLRLYFNIHVSEQGVFHKLQNSSGHESRLTMMNEAMTYLGLRASCERQGLVLASVDEADGSLHELNVRMPPEGAPVVSVSFAVNPEALEKLRQQTGQSSVTGMIEAAVALYEAIQREKDLGRSIVRLNPETGNYKRVSIAAPLIKPAGRDFI